MDWSGAASGKRGRTPTFSDASNLGIYAQMMEIRAVEVTSNAVDDEPMPTARLGQIDSEEALLSVSGDRIYDTKDCHEAIALREGALEGEPSRCKHAKRESGYRVAGAFREAEPLHPTRHAQDGACGINPSRVRGITSVTSFLQQSRAARSLQASLAILHQKVDATSRAEKISGCCMGARVGSPGRSRSRPSWNGSPYFRTTGPLANVPSRNLGPCKSTPRWGALRRARWRGWFPAAACDRRESRG